MDGLGRIEFREEKAADHAFVEALYLDSVGPLLRVLESFDEAASRERFRSVHRAEEARVITADACPIGWLELEVKPKHITLRQIHLVASARGHGLGSRLLRTLLQAASTLCLSVSLHVIRNNPACALYQRLGFKVVGESGTKLRMLYIEAESRTARSARCVSRCGGERSPPRGGAHLGG